MNAEKISAIQYIELHSLKHWSFIGGTVGHWFALWPHSKVLGSNLPRPRGFLEFASFLQIHQPPPQSRNWHAMMCIWRLDNFVTQLTLALNVSVNGWLSHMSALLAGQLFMVYSASQMKVVGTVKLGKCPILSKQGFTSFTSRMSKRKYLCEGWMVLQTSFI